jgi:hypothetical protein
MGVCQAFAATVATESRAGAAGRGGPELGEALGDALYPELGPALGEELREPPEPPLGDELGPTLGAILCEITVIHKYYLRTKGVRMRSRLKSVTSHAKGLIRVRHVTDRSPLGIFS